MRTALLTQNEVSNVLALKGKIPVQKLTKKLKLSRSTIYRIFDGSYHARPNPQPITAMPERLDQMDDLTVATVQFVLAKTHLEKLTGRPIMVG